MAFVVKTFLFTIALVLVMQIRWDRATIEEHTMIFLTESSLVQPLNATAENVVRFIRNSWNGVMSTIDTNFTRGLRSDSRPGQRQLRFNVERSKDYLVKKSNEASEIAREGYDYAREEMRQQTARLKNHLKDEGVIDESEQ